MRTPNKNHVIRQAIETKYLPPTNTKGSRIRATCSAKSIIVNWDYEFDVIENHELAAAQLFNELGWNTKGVKLYGGALGKNRDYCFVMVGGK
jgi:hypothetical protein